jgi:hypothetical protein
VVGAAVRIYSRRLVAGRERPKSTERPVLDVRTAAIHTGTLAVCL